MPMTIDPSALLNLWSLEELGPRRRRSADERHRVVEETLEARASVARVALKYGVNANQVFQWRRLYRDGKLRATPESAMKLLPVSVTDDEELLSPEPLAREIAMVRNPPINGHKVTAQTLCHLPHVNNSCLASNR
ncbi:MAG: putative transposition-related protein [Edaphobacter sp.]|nr:putative transposition-related protein [Edaphobacter sp.]